LPSAAVEHLSRSRGHDLCSSSLVGPRGCVRLLRCDATAGACWSL